MHLEDLRPRGGVDVSRLRRLVEGQGWRAALPSALPEDVLLGLARDLSCVEGTFNHAFELNGVQNSSSFASVIYVVARLLMQHLEGEGGSDEITIPLMGMGKAPQVYHWALEREIAARITGLSAEIPETFLLSAMWDGVHDNAA